MQSNPSGQRLPNNSSPDLDGDIPKLGVFAPISFATGLSQLACWIASHTDGGLELPSVETGSRGVFSSGCLLHTVSNSQAHGGFPTSADSAPHKVQISSLAAAAKIGPSMGIEASLSDMSHSRPSAAVGVVANSHAS